MITIYKYDTSQVKITSKGVLIFGYDTSYIGLRVEPLKPKTVFVPDCHLADYTDPSNQRYIYVPSDRVPAYDLTHEFTPPIAAKTISKYNWGKLKSNYKFKGA